MFLLWNPYSFWMSNYELYGLSEEEIKIVEKS